LRDRSASCAQRTGPSSVGGGTTRVGQSRRTVPCSSEDLRKRPGMLPRQGLRRCRFGGGYREGEICQRCPRRHRGRTSGCVCLVSWPKSMFARHRKQRNTVLWCDARRLLGKTAASGVLSTSVIKRRASHSYDPPRPDLDHHDHHDQRPCSCTLLASHL
jgi:hypothetical protein